MKCKPATIYISACLFCGTSHSDFQPPTHVSFIKCTLCGIPKIQLTLGIPSIMLNDYAKIRSAIDSNIAECLDKGSQSSS